MVFPIIAALGFMDDERTACHTSSDADTRDKEVSSIHAFNFMSGFLCLTIPVVFVLLLIYGICDEFKNNLFNRPYVRRFLIVLIIVYIAVCIIIGVGELALSIYVASIIYPIYPMIRNNTATTDPTIHCSDAVYYSAFTCLTVLYILVFVLLIVIVGLVITKTVKKYFHTVLDHYITPCLQAFRPNGQPIDASRPLADGDGRPSAGARPLADGNVRPGAGARPLADGNVRPGAGARPLVEETIM